MTDKWVKRWKVPKSNGDGTWTVAIDKDGIWLQLSGLEIPEVTFC